MAQHFSTATVDERSQLGYWRDVVCGTFVRYGFESPRHATAGFHAQVTAQPVARAQVTTVISEPHVVFRSPTEIRSSPADHYLVNLAVCGRIVVTQDGHDADLRPGDLTVYDSERPCRIACPDQFELITLKVPRQVFDAHARLPREAFATLIHGDRGVGALLSQLLSALPVRAPELTGDGASRVMSTVLDLLHIALTERVGIGGRADIRQEAQAFRARRYITNHLADPELSPTAVAGALGISVRYLHLLFRSDGTSPGRWIQERRLETAARMLTDPRHAGRSITNIAFAVGFKDAAHFSRTFRIRHGAAPRDYRRAGS